MVKGLDGLGYPAVDVGTTSSHCSTSGRFTPQLSPRLSAFCGANESNVRTWRGDWHDGSWGRAVADDSASAGWVQISLSLRRKIMASIGFTKIFITWRWHLQCHECSTAMIIDSPAWTIRNIAGVQYSHSSTKKRACTVTMPKLEFGKKLDRDGILCWLSSCLLGNPHGSNRLGASSLGASFTIRFTAMIKWWRHYHDFPASL